jgi:hypothetical protein
MNRRPLLCGATLTVLCALNGPVGAQTPTAPDMSAMMKMAEPAPPRPGDAAMSCAQIGQEMQSILKKKNVRPNAQRNTKAACELQRSMTLTPAEQAALSNPSPQAELLREQKSAQIQAATQNMMAANSGMMEAMNDPRLMRLAILADEKHCAFEEQEPPAQAPVADTCGSGVVTPAMVTGGVVPPAPASTGRPDPFKPVAKPPVTAPAVTPPSSPVTPASGDPFVKQGNAAPPPQKQPTADPFKKD